LFANKHIHPQLFRAYLQEITADEYVYSQTTNLPIGKYKIKRGYVYAQVKDNGFRHYFYTKYKLWSSNYPRTTTTPGTGARVDNYVKDRTYLQIKDHTTAAWIVDGVTIYGTQKNHQILYKNGDTRIYVISDTPNSNGEYLIRVTNTGEHTFAINKNFVPSCYTGSLAQDRFGKACNSYNVRVLIIILWAVKY
jgi:hypothetical protein